MAISEIEVVGRTGGPLPPSSAAPASPAPTRRAVALGLLAATACVVGSVLYVALDVLADVRVEIRVVGVLVALVAGYIGSRSAGRLAFGPRFDAGYWLSIAWLAIAGIAAVCAGLLPFTESRDPSRSLTEPVLARPDLFSRHPLGTDRQGLDILGGIAYGLRVSFVVGFGTVGVGVLVGGLTGILAGYKRGKLDYVVGLTTNTLLAFPPLILLMAAAAVLSRNLLNLTLALVVVTIPTYVRLGRAHTLVVMQKEFVMSARALGARSAHIIARHIAPRVLRAIVPYALVVIAVVIVSEASLSFLGLGIPRPEPTLGNMVSAGQTRFRTDPHAVFAPAIVLFVTVYALNRIGESMKRRSSAGSS